MTRVWPSVSKRLFFSLGILLAGFGLRLWALEALQTQGYHIENAFQKRKTAAYRLLRE